MWFSRTTSWPTNVEQPHDRVADDGGAQVADVHLLGHVRRRVVDDEPVRLAGGGDAEPLVGGDGGERGGEEAGVDGEVDEPGPGDLGGRHRLEVGGRDHVARDVPRVAAEPLGERQGAVRLGVGAIRRADDGVERRGLVGTQPAGTTDRHEGRGEAVGQERQQVGHGCPIVAAGVLVHPPIARTGRHVPAIDNRPRCPPGSLMHRSGTANSPLTRTRR